jgi:two-component system, OmpR family, response regulator
MFKLYDTKTTMKNRPAIFFAEDDLSFGSVLKSYLEINDYAVTWVDDGKYALDRFKNGSFKLCILDVMLPHVDGFTLATQIRGIDRNIPFIFLTAKTLREDVLKGYNLGADDYITKPFDSEVLLCKINAILKRSKGLPELEKTNVEVGSYLFDTNLRQISGNGILQNLSPKEADLLKLLLEYKNDLMPRGIALLKIWGDDSYFTARSMDVFISKLRKYFIADPRIEIKNIHGSGYIFSINEE